MNINDEVYTPFSVREVPLSLINKIRELKFTNKGYRMNSLVTELLELGYEVKLQQLARESNKVKAKAKKK